MGVTRRNRRVAGGLPQYLELRLGGVYGCRIDVPKRLRLQLGRSKFVISHETRDLATALVRHKSVVARVLGLIAFADAAQANQPARLTPVQIQALVRQVAELVAGQATGTGAMVPAVTSSLADLAIGDFELINHDVAAQAEARRYGEAAVDSDALAQWRTEQLRQAQILLGRTWHQDDTESVAMAHHRGVVLGLRLAAGHHADWQRYLEGKSVLEALPDDSVFEHPQASGGDGGLLVNELVERWIKHRQPVPKTAVEVRALVGRVRTITNLVAVDQIDVAAGRSYRDARLEDVSGTTTRKDLALLRAIWSWGVDEGLAATNPWDSVRCGRGDSGNEPRLPFTGEQVATILRHASVEADPDSKWSWPLGLMCSLRIEEFCCLRRQDLQLLDGIPCIVVDPDAQLGGRLKTRSSERVIPLPAALLQIGFWEWGRAQHDGYLFDAPSIPKADPRRSHSLSTRNGQALHGRWGIPSKRLTFHSTRHTFAKRAVQADLSDRVVKRLMGHSDGSMTARYGGNHNLAQLKAAIDLIGWPEISAWGQK